MQDLPNFVTNVAISDFKTPPDQKNSSFDVSVNQCEQEVSLVSQITDNAKTPASLDQEVKALLSDAVNTAETTDSSSFSKPQHAKEELVIQNPVVSLATAQTFNALAAFVAGLAVVGVVYAFAVKGGFNQYNSVVLGESTESSR